jgi:hypothetical protein
MLRRVACLSLQLTASEMQIRSYVFDVVRATVPSIILDDVFTVSGAVWLLVAESILQLSAVTTQIKKIEA